MTFQDLVPKPHTVDIIASLGLSLMRHSPAGASWKVRTYDLGRIKAVCSTSWLASVLVHSCGIARRRQIGCFSNEGVAVWKCTVSTRFSRGRSQFVGNCHFRILGALDKLLR